MRLLSRILTCLVLAGASLAMTLTAAVATDAGSEGDVTSTSDLPVHGPTLEGPCQGQAAIVGDGVIDPAVSGGRYVVQRAGSAQYQASIAQPPGDRSVTGYIALTLPPPLPAVNLGEWGPDGAETSASGDYTWDEEMLPELYVPAGVPFEVAGEHHDVSGTCTGSVELVIAGGFLDSPVGLVSLALTGLSLAGLLYAARGVPVAVAKEPCPDELAAWERAKRECEEARAAAAEARAAADEAKATRDALQRDLGQIRERYPDAGKPAGDAWVESEGRRITSSDVRAGKAADRAAWKAYRDGELSAEELMEQWGKRPEDVAEFKELDTKAQELDGKLGEAKAAAEDAEARATRAEEKAEQACQGAEDARDRLDRCREQASEPEAGIDGTTGVGTSSGGATATAGGANTAGGGTVAAGPGTLAGTRPREEEGCGDRPDEERNPVTKSVRVPAGLQTRMAGFVGHDEAERGRDIAEDMGKIGATLGWISTAMTLVPGRTLVHDFDGWKALEIGASTTIGQVSGRLEATGHVSIPTPTNPIQAGVDTLSLFYTLGGKLTEAWSGFVERYDHNGDLWVAKKYVQMELTCVEVWGCVDDRWVMKGKRFYARKTREYKTGEKHFFPINWPGAQEEIGKWARRLDGELKRALKEMDAFKQGCQG